METVLEIVTAGGPSSFRYAATYVLRIEGTGELRLRERLPGTGEIVELATFSYEEGVPELYTDLVANEQITVYRVAIPEGLTSWQIVQGLNQADFLTGEVVDIPSEGSLAPDTYEVQRGDDRKRDPCPDARVAGGDPCRGLGGPRRGSTHRDAGGGVDPGLDHREGDQRSR